MRFSLLLLCLLLCAGGRAHADDTHSAAIVDLNVTIPTGSQFLDSIRRDLSVAGFTINEKSAVLRGLNGAIENPDLWGDSSQLLQDAESDYENFEFSDALGKLKEVDALLVDASAQPEGKGLLARRYLLEGLIRFAQKRTGKALDSFRLTNRLMPSFQSLDAGNHRPAVVKLFAEATQLNSNAQPSAVSQHWKPKAASLFLDGRKVKRGSTIKQGPHLLMLRHLGYATESVVVNFTAHSKIKPSLQTLSLTEQLTILRSQAAISRDSSVARFKDLANLVEVDVLVLVHSGPEGPRAAIYTHDEQSLSSWVKVGSMQWQSLLSLGESSDKPLTVLKSEPGRAVARPWYKKWWGGGLLVGGTALVGGALYLALSPSDSSGDGVTIDQWCFGSCD